uniref:Uncharacterized protein n=1 Tax=Lepeophtheirus salmonis TaxID=72036 RepID=A0A0K2U7E6_LEPSM
MQRKHLNNFWPTNLWLSSSTDCSPQDYRLWLYGEPVKPPPLQC